LLVRARLPPLGYATVELSDDAKVEAAPATASNRGGLVVVESDFYRIEFDSARGGTIHSLVAKKLGNRDFVDAGHERRFNELRGHFYQEGGFHSSADQSAIVSIKETGPLRVTVEISGKIAASPFVQRVSVVQGSPVIDCSARLEWNGSPRIGEFEEKDGYRNPRRAAYDDRFKLLALFPANLSGQRIAKNAPFDVCESGLKDTFYNSWEDIKNNVILDWVDETDSAGSFGLALFSDHTTSYTHGTDFPLGLTIQYAGKGLWGRDYAVDGPTEVRYALMPHAGRWDTAGVSAAAMSWLEPAVGAFARGGEVTNRTLIDLGTSGWEAPAMYAHDGALFVRLFNASGSDAPREVGIGFEAGKIERLELDGRVIERLVPKLGAAGACTVRLSIPRFGVRTLRLSELSPPRGNGQTPLRR
jgi:alpha-mannosidase